MILLVFAFFASTLAFPFPPYEYDCNAKLDRGIGNNHSQKFYFDKQWNNCFGFKYSGSGGSLNKFNTYTECLRACQYVDGNTCSSPFASVEPVKIAFTCKSIICPKGSECKMGMFIDCCNTTLDDWALARYDSKCPNGGAASVETVAKTCSDLLCGKGEKCIQINPYFARCCGAKVNVKSIPSADAQDNPYN
ncbi:hypothetical protein QR680_007096 [Steinernema hermaphroditum]|uniref:BPTI/Kunitz inhibitor domain-containing protein n=1 Tax=Steinernema hermaphroditum TaxID=289476 RepID=A0AA39HXM1_9BILA|nr:hypothetical protein QR680_007096 [Steinernema hermaphroditum]